MDDGLYGATPFQNSICNIASGFGRLPHIVLLFSSTAAANYPVAGIPAAARAAREIQLALDGAAESMQCLIAVPGGWMPSDWCLSELARLAEDIAFDCIDSNGIDIPQDTIFIDGRAFPPASAIRSALDERPLSSRGVESSAAAIYEGWRLKGDSAPFADLDEAGRLIVMATAKANDGIVSRYVNRPISRSITRTLLRIEGVRPGHATVGTATLGIAMALCLFTGGPTGLILGALLFQSASIFDGVDGEIARATFRTSHRGAMLDSLVDAATNLAFISGLAYNLWLQGFARASAAGLGGLALLATGLGLIGMRARASGGPFTFDGVKHRLQQRPSAVMQWLIWITMRDFYAAAMAVAVVAGLAAEMLVTFFVVTAGWFLVTLSTLAREDSQSRRI